MDKPRETKFRLATDKDFDELRRIGYAELTYKRLKNLQPGYLDAIKDRYWSDEVFAEALMLDENALLVAEEDRRIIGFGEFASYVHHEVFIHKLFVSHDRQGQGIGTRLVGDYLDRQKLLVKWLRTEVIRGDNIARKFWEKRGYKAGKPYEWDLDTVVIPVVPFGMKRRVKFKSSLSREMTVATEPTRVEEEAKARENSSNGSVV